MLNSFGADVDLDWMHSAVSTDNSDELKDMFDDIWEGYAESDEDMESEDREYMFDEEYEGEYEEAMEDAEEVWEEFEEEFEEEWSDFEEDMEEEWESEETTTEETEALMNAKAWGTERRGSRRHWLFNP